MNNIKEKELILLPAYGRRYKNSDEALKDWEAGKDFKIQGGGPYCSIRDKETIYKTYDKITIMYFGEITL